MESMDNFFKDFHQQAKAALYMVEAAVSDVAFPTTKRPTRTVRQPFLLQAVPAETERSQEVEDAIIGTWCYGETGRKKPTTYKISIEDGKLIFREGKRKGTLVPSCDNVSLVAKLVRANGDVHGSIKLRLQDGKVISNFRPHGSTLWGENLTAKRKEDVATTEQDSCEAASSSSSVAPRCQKSRVVPEADNRSLKHAKTAPPQELHFIAPQDCTPGAPVCLSGPHGDPIVVPMPEGAEPGKPCSIYLGPTKSVQVVVPEGALPGSVVLFTTEDDGDMLHTVVPAGKKPGDTFDIVPPVVLIQVPKGSTGGDEVLYTTPEGGPAMVQVPAGFSPGHYFPTLLPVAQNLADIAFKQPNGVPQARKASTLQQVVCDAKKTMQGDANVPPKKTTSGSIDQPSLLLPESQSDGEHKEPSGPEVKTANDAEGGLSPGAGLGAVPPGAITIPDEDPDAAPLDSPTAEAPRSSSPTALSPTISRDSPEGDDLIELQAEKSEALAPLVDI